ncbi:MAG TPA: tRNA 2-selenouridine(34) synthase MnmH [Chitinophagaceae bacterium]|jgi:tRNA 2-selenouridine synthase|nr:tRNA 2-selenouridine(34) synthase MnmH [Chitinophagaceae bacterium]
MAVERIPIERFMALAKHHPVIDVRSPAEYKHAHIPGAHSLPLFSDEERKIVGTAYKQQSREAAIKLGLDLFGPKMKKMVEDAESMIGNKQLTIGNRQQAISNPANPGSSLTAHDSRSIFIYCWRGGMRSGAVSWLLDLYGFKVYTLVGGYKKFRNYTLDTFKLPFQFNILGGYTGSGKTGLIKALKEKGERVIDLEAIAVHKGSAFGNIGLPPQPGQEMFENLLAGELRSYLPLAKPNLPIWLEDESQRIGLVNIPPELWKNMRQSPVWFLDIPFEERLKNIVQEYGPLDPERVVDAIGRISEKLGHLNAKTAILLLKEGKIAESFDILLRYYDKFYFKALHNREAVNSLLYTIECKSITPENADQLIAQCQSKAARFQPEKI